MVGSKINPFVAIKSFIPLPIQEVLSSSKMIKANWFYGRMAYPFGVRYEYNLTFGRALVNYVCVCERERNLSLVIHPGCLVKVSA